MVKRCPLLWYSILIQTSCNLHSTACIIQLLVKCCWTWFWLEKLKVGNGVTTFKPASMAGGLRRCNTCHGQAATGAHQLRFPLGLPFASDSSIAPAPVIRPTALWRLLSSPGSLGWSYTRWNFRWQVNRISSASVRLPSGSLLSSHRVLLSSVGNSYRCWFRNVCYAHCDVHCPVFGR